MKLRERHKPSVVDDDSSDDDLPLVTPSKRQKLKDDSTPRGSERIRTRNSRSFEKPTRQKVFNSISSKTSPQKLVESLKPRRLVNNFTKENHRYNYDPNYTDDSSADDFINDELSDQDGSDGNTDSSQSDDSENRVSKSPTPPPDLQLKKRHHTNILESDSDSSGEANTKTGLRHNSIIESDSEGEDIQQELSPKSEQHSPADAPCKSDEEIPVEVMIAENSHQTPGEKTEAVAEFPDAEVGNSDESIGDGSKNSNGKCRAQMDSDLSDSEIISPKSTAASRSQRKAPKRQVIDSGSSDSDDEKSSPYKRAFLASDASSDSMEERLYSSGDEEHGHRTPSVRAQIVEGRKDYRRGLLAELTAKRKRTPSQKLDSS